MLSPLAHAIVDTLTWRVRAIAHNQIAKLSELLGASQPASEIHWLLRQGYIAQIDCSVNTNCLNAPLATWTTTGDDVPDFGRLCWRAKSRGVGDGSITASKVYAATKLAEAEFGGCGGKLRQPLQLAHDLGTTSVFLAKVEFFGWEDCNDWIGEDVIRRHYRHLNIEKVPDAAFIFNERIGCVIEFVGRDYAPSSLRKFHRHWSQRQIPYEVW